MMEFDKDNISDAALRKIQKYTMDPSFTPMLVAKASSVAAAFCEWVHSIVIYAVVSKEVEPKRVKLRNAQEKLQEINGEVEQAKSDLRVVLACLEASALALQR